MELRLSLCVPGTAPDRADSRSVLERKQRRSVVDRGLTVRTAHQVLELTESVFILSANVAANVEGGVRRKAQMVPDQSIRQTPLPQRSSDQEPFCFRPLRPSCTPLQTPHPCQTGGVRRKAWAWAWAGAPCELSVVWLIQEPMSNSATTWRGRPGGGTL
ncbi:hypothetical protein VTN02DRAFT_776 [Thermoascus thermophilus]